MTKHDFWWKFVERPKRVVESFFRRIFKIDGARLVQAEADRHRGELAIDPCDRIVKFLGWTDSEEEDRYWVHWERNRGIVLNSCCGGYIWLKGRLSGFDYYRLLDMFEKNTDGKKLEKDLKGIKVK